MPEALRLDAALFRHLGEIGKPAGCELVQFLEGADVVTDGDPGLDDAGIGKQPRERPAEGREVQADQHHKFRTGKLNERGRVTFAFLEGRAGFGIEPEERFLFEKIQGTGHLAFGLDKHYLAFVGQHGQVVDFFFGKWCSASCV